MALIISVANQKGGVGKSTTAHALRAGLKSKTLLIDIDPQANISYISNVNTELPTVYELLTRQCTIEETIQKTSHGDIIAGSGSLSSIDKQLDAIGKEYRLKELLEPIKSKYEYVIIDTPPALSILTINALTASDCVIITAQADILSVRSIGQLYNTIDAVRKYTNKDLSIKGILLTRHVSRSILSKDLMESITETAKEIGTFVYSTPIRECIALKEAQATQQDIFTYAPKSNASNDYKSFIKELKRNLK